MNALTFQTRRPYNIANEIETEGTATMNAKTETKDLFAELIAEQKALQERLNAAANAKRDEIRLQIQQLATLLNTDVVSFLTDIFKADFEAVEAVAQAAREAAAAQAAATVATVKTRKPRAPNGSVAPKTPKVAPQFAHPENAELTWSGRGREPKWFTDFVAKGGNAADLEISEEALAAWKVANNFVEPAAATA